MSMQNSDQLHVIYLATNADKLFYDALNQYLLKAKNDVVVHLLVNASDSRLKDFADKKNVVTTVLENTIGNAINKTLENCQGIAALSYDVKVPVGTIVAWMGSNKKLLQHNAITVASQALGKAAKTKLNLSYKISNSINRLLTPVNLRDTQTQILMGSVNDISIYYSNALLTADSYSKALYFSAASGIQMGEAAISLPSNNGLGLLNALVNSVKLRFSYYTKQALAENKISNFNLQNGNGPIYRMLYFVLVLAACFVLPVLSQDFGSTWDEKAHNDYAQLSYNYFTSFGNDTAALAEPTNNADWVRQAYRFYGEQLNTVAAFAYNWFGTGVYETRHFINSIYALIGLIFTSLIALSLTNFRGGILALLFMFFNPGWLGFGSNNPTDIPFAAGFAFAGYFMIKVLKNMPTPKFSQLFWLAFGIGLAIASRVGAFLLLAYFGLFLAVLALNQLKLKQQTFGKLFVSYAKLFLIVAVISYAFGIITWPYGLSNPLVHPIQAFSKASENAFYTNNVELFEGKRMYMITDAPWYYVIKFIGMGNPLYLLLGFAISLIALAMYNKKWQQPFMLMLLFMIVFPIAYAEYSNINYYNGWRHYLFILPSLVPLAVIGYEFLLNQKKWVAAVAAILLLILFVKPTYWLVKNHPNEYVYFNELAGGLKGAYGNYETDYYSNSCREAAEWIAKQHPNGKLTIGINNEITTAAYWAQQINPDLQFIWVREYEEQKPFWDYLILTSRTFSKNELLNGSFPPANTVYTVMADGVPLAAVVKRTDYFMPLGYKNLDAQQFDSAAFYFGEAVKKYPKDEEAWRMLGFTYLNKANFDTAEQFIRKSIDIYPQNFSAYSNLGIIYFNRKQFKEAIANFDTATRLKENLTEAWYYSALAYLNQGDYNNGIKNMEMSIKHNGQFPEAYYYLGKAYAAVGNLNKASESLQGALSLNPNMLIAWSDLANVFNQLGQTQQANYCMEEYRKRGGR